MTDRINLHKVLDKRAFDFAILTTYEFDAVFFEQFVLERLSALATNNAIAVFIDQGKLHELVHASDRERPRLAGVRYVLCPARAKGVFHPKIQLYASRNHGLLVIGSANLTRPGLSRNAEMVTVLRYRKDEQTEHLPVFRAALSVLATFAERWPSPTLTEMMRQLVLDCPWLASDHCDDAASGVSILHNLDEPLWPQLVQRLDGPVLGAQVLSPYFDAEPAIIDDVTASVGDAPFSLYTERAFSTMTPRWLDRPEVARGQWKILVTSYEDEKPQRLHAKALALRSSTQTVLAYGSANFTRAALMSTPSDGNVEALVVVEGLPADLAVAELFDPMGLARAAEAEDLCAEPKYTPLASGSADIRLVEAALDESLLSVTLEGLPGTAKAVVAAVQLPARNADRLPLMAYDAVNPWQANVPDTLLRASAGQAATVVVEARMPDGRRLRSNPVFLLNLQDAPTGRTRRDMRRVREAQQSAAHFAAVLEELLARDDDDELIRFLSLCNIKLVEAGRGPTRRPKGTWPGIEGRVLGKRKLQLFTAVNEAARSFIERHLRRLRRQIAAPTLAAIPSVMHLARAVVGVIAAQLDRLVSGLETTKRLSAARWARLRELAAPYIADFESCLSMVTTEYLTALRSQHGDEVGPAVLPDVQPLLAVADSVFAIAGRLERGTPKVVTEDDFVCAAPFFERDMLRPAYITGMSRRLRPGLESLGA